LDSGNRSLRWEDHFNITNINPPGKKLYRFIWESRTNTLGTLSRVKKWKPNINDRCICGASKETVQHIIGSCRHNLGIYRKRHNLIINAIYSHINRNRYTSVFKEHMPFRADKRIDLWLENGSNINVVEVSVTWNNRIKITENEKVNQYEDYCQWMKIFTRNEYYQKVAIIGQLGGFGSRSLNHINSLKIRGNTVLMRRLQGIAIYGSYWSWLARCRRNSSSW